VQRDGGEWCPFCVEAAHEFGGEVLSLGHASAVAGDQQPPACLMTIGDTMIHEAAGEDISAWIAQAARDRLTHETWERSKGTADAMGLTRPAACAKGRSTAEVRMVD
jgi:hypothetical protein